MESDKRISEVLVETGSFTDLEEPVILTSGELGIYYVNTEKLVQDGGKWKEYGEDSETMIKHAVNMTLAHQSFDEVIDILAEKVDSLLFDGASDLDPLALSGGQRRDWIFSGPVAHKLGLPHISLYKNGKMEVVAPNGGFVEGYRIKGSRCVHVVDLITEASSCYRTEGDIEQGWIPMLRQKGAIIHDLAAVVTRNQGGEEKLSSQGVGVTSFVSIDEAFAREFSKNPERAVAYMANPRGWCESYLRDNPIPGTVINTFDPEGGKIDRAKKFLDRYSSVLTKSGRMDDIHHAVQSKYEMTLSEIMEGN